VTGFSGPTLTVESVNYATYSNNDSSTPGLATFLPTKAAAAKCSRTAAVKATSRR
jgi:hypothetical protein